jgi:hypothetical protein
MEQGEAKGRRMLVHRMLARAGTVSPFRERGNARGEVVRYR